MLDKRLEVAYEAAKIISEKLSGISGIDIDFCIYGIKINFPRNRSNVYQIIAGKIIDPDCVGYWREYSSFTNDPLPMVNVSAKDDDDAANKLAEKLIEEIKEILEVKPARDEEIITEIASAVIDLFLYDCSNQDFLKFKLKLSEDGNLKVSGKSKEMIVTKKLLLEDIAYNAGLSLDTVQEQLPFLKPSDLNF